MIVIPYQIEKYRDRGFEILGVDTMDTREAALVFIEKHQLRWTQTMEPDKEPIQTLYRVTGSPSYFLIGADGSITVGVTNESLNPDRALRTLLP